MIATQLFGAYDPRVVGESMEIVAGFAKQWPGDFMPVYVAGDGSAMVVITIDGMFLVHDGPAVSEARAGLS